MIRGLYRPPIPKVIKIKNGEIVCEDSEKEKMLRQKYREMCKEFPRPSKRQPANLKAKCINKDLGD